MRTSMVRMVAMWAAVLVLVGIPAVWSVARASDGRTLGQVQQEDEDGDLATRVAELETQVAELQTAVAELRGSGMAEESDDGDPAPTQTPMTVTTQVPEPCGRPYGQWGAATADGVTVKLIQQVDGAEADEPFEVEGRSVVALEVMLANNGENQLALDPAHFVVTDCEGEAYTGQDGGVEPALEPGDLDAGDEARGWVTFVLPAGAQAAGFVYHIPSPGRSGAQVSCPLVDEQADPDASGAMGGAGCSARGGSAG